MKLFLSIFTFLILLNNLPTFSNEMSLEEEIEEAFENYPFKCNPEGSTPEIAACTWIELIKSDRALKK